MEDDISTPLPLDDVAPSMTKPESPKQSMRNTVEETHGDFSKQKDNKFFGWFKKEKDNDNSGTPNHILGAVFDESSTKLGPITYVQPYVEMVMPPMHSPKVLDSAKSIPKATDMAGKQTQFHSPTLMVAPAKGAQSHSPKFADVPAKVTQIHSTIHFPKVHSPKVIDATFKPNSVQKAPPLTSPKVLDTPQKTVEFNADTSPANVENTPSKKKVPAKNRPLPAPSPESSNKFVFDSDPEDYMDEELFQNTHHNANYVNVEVNQEVTTISRNTGSKVQFAKMVEQVQFDSYSSSDEEFTKLNDGERLKEIVPRISSLVNNEAKTETGQSERRAQVEVASYGIKRQNTKSVSPSKIFGQQLKKDSTEEFKKEATLQLISKPALEERKIRHVLTQTPTKQSPVDDRIAQLEGHVKLLQDQNAQHKSEIKALQDNLNEAVSEKEGMIVIMGTQKSKFDKLSATAYKKIKELLTDHKILGIEVKSLKSQVFT